ncbi:MAG: S8 family serine peptidase [Verrucomicrobiae bacterium]|nr:S8 family serine peptidase [Verrucomicrobiae bacterium]
MNRSRIVILAVALFAPLALWLGSPGKDPRTRGEEEKAAEASRISTQSDDVPVQLEEEVRRKIANLISPDRRDSHHPVERVAAEGEVLDERFEQNLQRGLYTRIRLIRSNVQPRLLRLEEDLSVAEEGREATVVRRDLFLADQLIVKTRVGVSEDSFRRGLVDLGFALNGKQAPGIYTVTLPQATLDAVPDALRSLSGLSDLVEMAEADGVGFGAGTPDDTQFPNQWGNHNTGQSGGQIDADVDAPEFWAVAGHAPDVVIAVLDSGLNFTHPDLAGIGWANPGEIAGDGIDNDGNGRIDDINGWDFVNSDNDPTDDHAHGSHVSGIIAAVRSNGAGVAGMLSGVKILPCKILNASNSGLTSNLIAATAYARLEGVPVMNLSLQNYPNSSLLSDEFDACATGGIVLCVAAGNQGVNNDSTPNYPSSFPQSNLLSVGNHNRLDARSSSSNFGASSVDLFAPGDTIISTVLGTSYQNFTGTSMATPYVAAVCGALKQLHPSWSALEIKSSILGTVVPKAAYAGISMTGGRLNAFDAVSEISTSPNLTLEHPAGLSLSSGSSSVNFGHTEIALPVVRTFTLGNSQAGTVLNLGTFTLTGENASDFEADLSGLDLSIQGGETTTFVVRFTPSAADVRNATLSISSNDPDTPDFSVSLVASASTPVGPSQEIIIRKPFPGTLSSTGSPVRIDAVATGGGPLTYEVIAGPATVDSSGTVTPTGGAGGVTVMIRQAGGGGFDATETYLTFGVGEMRSFTKVVAGFSSWATFAIRDDGTLWTWGYVNGAFQLGDNTSGGRTSPLQIGTATNWSDLSVGNAFGMGLRSDGSLWAWGSNFNGQLGDGTTTSRSSPIQIGVDKNWVSMDAGSSFGLAVADDGTLWGWGSNSSSQLGQGDTVQRTSPTQIGSATNWTHVSCGNSTSYALNEAGELWAWGQNSFGQLGVGDTTARNVPTRVGTDSDWHSIVAGNSHVLATKENGSLWAWGSGSQGQLGLGEITNRNTPNRVGTQTNWVSMGAGFSNSGGKTADGSLWAWGGNVSGQLANGLVGTSPTMSPQRFGTENQWESIDFGNSHVVALRLDGSIWVAGDSFGFSGAEPRALSRAADPGSSWMLLSGTTHSFQAVRQDGTLWHWGRASSGQFGNGGLSDRSTLTQTGTDTDWDSVETGGHTLGSTFTLALKTDGTLKAAGSNTYGQLGIGTTTSSSFFVTVDPSSGPVWDSVAVGSYFGMGIRNDGTLWGWGLNSNGQLGLGNSASPQLLPVKVGAATNWSAISCGSSFAAGIRSDGSLWAWGSNFSGQVGDGTTTSRNSPVQIGGDFDWVRVVCGASHALALKADGSLWAWGSNSLGQLGVGDQINRLEPLEVGSGRTWSRIFAGLNASAAIAGDGTLWTAGDNNSGQSGRGGIEPLLSLSQVGTSRNWQHVAVGAQNLVAIQSDGSFWVSGTTGPRVLEAGRKQGELAAIDAKLHSQTIQPLKNPIFPGETVRANGTSGLPAQTSVLSGPASASGNAININGSSQIRLRVWQAGDETTWDAAPPEEVLIDPSDELTLLLDSPSAMGVTVSGFQANLVNLSLALGYEPAINDELVLVENTSDSPIGGVFSGLPQGAPLYLVYNNATYGFRISYTGGDGNDVVITHEIVPQELTVASVGVKPSDAPAFSLEASTNSGLMPSFEVVAGPAAVQGSLVTLTGQPGGVTIRVSQAGSSRFSPAEDRYVTFRVGDWPRFTKIGASQSTWAHFAIHENGTLWSWGFSNGLGQLGDTGSYRNSPLQVGTANNWVDVDVGGAFAA